MANAAVTLPMRAHGWNVHFLAGHNTFHFAGLFQAAGSDLVTFSDVIDELRLCFEIPDVAPRNESDDDDNGSWKGIAFGLIGRPSPSSVLGPRLSFVIEEDLN